MIAPCFYCRRGMHDSCISGEVECPCCASWHCAAHDVWVTDSCPACDDELTASTEETGAARHGRRTDVAVAVRGCGMTAITFSIPADLWLSANDRRHWADKARRTRGLRTTVPDDLPDELFGACLGTTHVAAFIGYPRNGKADPANAAPTVKALIDGMVDAGVWPDDDSTYVIGPTYLRDKASGQAGVHTVRLVLTAQDVPWGEVS